MVRAEELRAGKIDHALALFVPCTEGYVYPATKGGLDCSDNGFDAEDRPAMGAHFQLPPIRTSWPRRRRGSGRSWRRFDRYGAYVVDTSGTEGIWGVKHESPNGYTSQGQDDPFVKLAIDSGIGAGDPNENGIPEYFFNFGFETDFSGLRLSRRRFSPCASRAARPAPGASSRPGRRLRASGPRSRRTPPRGRPG